MRRALLAVVLVAALTAPLARADGDPASDYLLSRRLFTPLSGAVSQGDTNRLTSFLEETKAKGYEIRVALIADRTDLGSVTALYRQPKLYARFLGQELAIVYHGRLLVVMPNGLGVAKNSKALASEQAIADRIPAPGTDGTALAQTAADAVAKFAALHGVRVTAPRFTGNGGGGGTDASIVIVVVIAVVLVLAVLAAVLLRRRRVRD